MMRPDWQLPRDCADGVVTALRREAARGCGWTDLGAATLSVHLLHPPGRGVSPPEKGGHRLWFAVLGVLFVWRFGLVWFGRADAVVLCTALTPRCGFPPVFMVSPQRTQERGKQNKTKPVELRFSSTSVFWCVFSEDFFPSFLKLQCF